MFYIKRLSNEVVFKFSKNVDFKIVNDTKIGLHLKWKKMTAMELEMCAEFKLAN